MNYQNLSKLSKFYNGQENFPVEGEIP